MIGSALAVFGSATAVFGSATAFHAPAGHLTCRQSWICSPTASVRRPSLSLASVRRPSLSLHTLSSSSPSAPSPTMNDVAVRSFQASDAPAVRRIFAEGMADLIWDGFLALAGAIAPLIAGVGVAAGGIAWAAGCPALVALSVAVAPIAAAVSLLYAYFRRQVLAYVDQSLADDLSDIDTFYMAKKPSHFWVAVERARGSVHGAEEVLGCVALEYKPEHKKYAGWAELRRMSVSRGARRRGVACRLNDALLTHCRQCQIKGVFLSTSTMQPAAIALYERLGYRPAATGNFYPYPLLKEAVQFVTFDMDLEPSCKQ